MAAQKLHVISPAPSRIRGDDWTWADFDRRATRRDNHGFPLEGSFGADYHVKLDLNDATEAQIKEAMQQRYRDENDEKSAKYIDRHTAMLLEIYRTLKEGDIIALKKGTTIIAFVQLTSNYYYNPDVQWGWHSWNYRLVRKATDADQPANKGALIKTFYPHFLARPLM
jgi:hypothetical protein